MGRRAGRDREQGRGVWAAPLLRWAGSKRKLVTLLRLAIPEGVKRYIEPFAGSACLFFATRPGAAVLGDINAELINTYDVVRKHPRRVARIVHAMPRTKRQYYRVREVKPETLTAIERAARFVYLNRNCFNGVYRTDRQGNFNVPMGKKTGRVPTEVEFYRCSVALRNAELRQTDFQEAVS